MAFPAIHKVASNFRVEDRRWQIELGFEFLLPLLSQGRGDDEENSAFPLCPPLGDDDTRLDGFSKADLVCENDAARKRRTKRKEGGVYLMGIEVHTSARNGTRKRLYAASCSQERQFACPILTSETVSSSECVLFPFLVPNALIDTQSYTLQSLRRNRHPKRREKASN